MKFPILFIKIIISPLLHQRQRQLQHKRILEMLRVVAGQPMHFVETVGERMAVNTEFVGTYSQLKIAFEKCLQGNDQFLRQSMNCLLYTSPSPRD